VYRRACMQLLRRQRVEVMLSEATLPPQEKQPVILSRASRAHYRLSWAERLARNAHPLGKRQVTIKLCGVPDHFAGFLR
jgi:hypothetical protein